MRVALAAALVLSVMAGTSAAQRTDVVVLQNGDHVTCEIKSLQYGYLNVETDSLGTIDIIWSDVRSVTSIFRFTITLISRVELTGSLESPADGTVVVRGSHAEASPPIPIQDIVQMRSARTSLWQRMDGYVEGGYTFARANKLRQWTLNANAVYSGLKWRHIGAVSSMFSSQEETEPTSRNTVTLESDRMVSARTFYSGVVQTQQNEELGLTLRTTAGGGVGRVLLQSNRRSLVLIGGLSYTHEVFDAVEGAQDNLEALIVSRLIGFRRHSPKLDLNVSFALMPSLTDTGRVRSELNVSISIEVFKDFSAGLTAFDSFDSRPPNDELTRNDYGTTTTLRWKF